MKFLKSFCRNRRLLLVSGSACLVFISYLPSCGPGPGIVPALNSGHSIDPGGTGVPSGTGNGGGGGSGGTPVSITTKTLPAGTVGQQYSATLQATGGTTPYTWSLSSGTLPQALTLSNSGTLSGTPTTSGSFSFTIKVTDSKGLTASQAFSLSIASSTGGSLSIITTSLQSGTVSVPYSATLVASGGTSPYTWTVTAGALPAGLTLSSSGTISGTPTTAGSSNFTVHVSDAVGGTASKAFSLSIASANPSNQLIISPTDLPNATVNASYSVTLSASGGTSPYSWSVTTGSLPAGLALNSSTGVISGTPTTPGWSNFFTLYVTDSAAKTSSYSYSMITNPVLDQYGGATSLTCTATGWFHAQEINSRWWLCDPLGNVFFMNAVAGMFVPDDGCDPNTGQCSNYQTIAKQKYGDLDVHWGPQQNRRLLSWGFNGIGELSTGSVQPIQTCPGCAGWGPNGQQPVQLPMVQTILVSNYAGVNLSNYASHPTKDMLFGFNSNYSAWRASIMDFYDPDFGQWMDNFFAADSNAQRLISSPWVVGLFLDDTDWFWGMGPGPDFHTIPSGHQQSDVGYMVMITSPVQTFNPNPAGRRTPEVYTDTKVYSKTAMASPPATCSIQTPCSLRDYFYKKYNGSISALNAAWGSNYTTFESAGIQVTGEVVGTGNGTTTVFNHTLAQAPVSPESALIKVGGSPQAGDCPWFSSGCNISGAATGSIQGASGTTIATGVTPWLSDNPCGAAGSNPNAPAAGFNAVVVWNGTGLFPSPSRQTGSTCGAGQGDIVIAPTSPPPGATGYDVYMSCHLTLSSTPAFGCVGSGTPVPPVTLQASNVPLGQNFAVPGTGLVSGSSLPSPPSTINYSNGQVQITFSTAPAQGVQITADYMANGWMYGTGLMDEDGRHTAWLGSNAVCLQAATACDGNDFALPNANANVAQDLDGWISQFSAQYFSTCRNILKKHAPNLMYMGADTIGGWWAPARKEILQGAAPYVDLMFTTWLPGQPDPTTSQAMYQYQTQYFGDKPMLDATFLVANADSSLYRYSDSFASFRLQTQSQRGQTYQSFSNSMLNATSFNGTHQWVGAIWWGLVDFWNEKLDWGLISLEDNPYDGKSAVQAVGKDPWGFATGGEEKNYGDAIDYVKQGNSQWYGSAH